MTINTAPVLPCNELGEILAVAGTGTSNYAGNLPFGAWPIDSVTKKLAIVGFGTGGGSSTPAPAAITASRNLASSDNGGTLYSALTTATVLTVPSGLPTGFGVAVAQTSTGTVQIVAGSGVTVNNVSSFTKTSAQWAVISLVQTTANGYILVGSGQA